MNKYKLYIPIFIVFLGVLAFQMGVNVQNIPTISERNISMHILYSLNLFTLGGAEYCAPISGPLWAQFMLYSMYFIAPLISIATILEAILQNLNLKLRYTLWKVGHVIVIGTGRVGNKIPTIIKQFTHKDLPILLIDKRQSSSTNQILSTINYEFYATNKNLIKMITIVSRDAGGDEILSSWVLNNP